VNIILKWEGIATGERK